MKKIQLVVIFSFAYFSLFGQWIPVGGGVFSSTEPVAQRGAIWDMEVFQGELYIVGEFDSVGGKAMKNFAKWDGTEWHAVPIQGVANHLTVYKGELILAGNTGSIGPVQDRFISKWDGVSWEPLSDSVSISTIFPEVTPIRALKVINDDLFIGGVIDGFGNTSVDGLLYWDGSTYKKHTPLSENNNCVVLDIESYLGNIIVSGACYSLIGQSTPGISKYNSGSFDSIRHQFSPKNLISYDSFLISGSEILDINGDIPQYTPHTGSITNDYALNNDFLFTISPNGKSIVYADPFLSFNALGDTLPDPGQILSIEIFQGELYIAGLFHFVGEKDKTSILQFNGNLPSGIAEEGNTSSLIVSPNPSDGIFEIEGLSDQFQHVQILDINGRVVLYQKTAMGTSMEFDISLESPGLYFLKLTGQRSVTKKVIVK